MSARPKIGVLTFHNCINYGSYWQACCLVEGLRREGHDAELIDHRCDEAARAELRCAFQPTLPTRASREAMRGYARKVRRFAEAFADLPLSAPVSLQADGIADYDIVVIGSDEVWNLGHPWYGGKPLFYGAGIGARRLVAYAGSFGSYSCHWGLEQVWADRLKAFHALSVRDRNSYWLVKGTTGREPPLVLDPCLQFADIARQNPAPPEEPFALVYGHGFPAWFVAAAKAWARAVGLKLRSVGYHNGFADEQRLDAGPAEFARLMSAARAVVTNYFHGCVFALLNGKPFVATTSDYRRNKLVDLADKLGVQERIVDERTPARSIRHLLGTAPGRAIAERIAEVRSRSSEFLGAALG